MAKVLSWRKRVENLNKKLSKTNGIISKLRHYVSTDTCRSIYYYLFHSNLIYGILVWSFTNKVNIEKKFKLQKKCLRIIAFSHFDAHSDPLFSKLNLLKGDDIITFQIIKFMFEFTNNKLPICLNELFITKNDIHQYPTRGVTKLYLPKYNTQFYGRNSSKFNGPFHWNQFLSKG